MKEIKLALQECARKLGLFLSGKRKAERHKERIKTFEKYAQETVNAVSELTEESKEKIMKEFMELINSKNNQIVEEEENGEPEAEGAGEECSESDRE
jgi:DNA topoisomerase VI subunit B